MVMISNTPAKTAQVRWNGAKDDPESIVQDGVTFKKGVWTPVPIIVNTSDPNFVRMTKFAGNPWFEVQGADKSEHAPNAGGTLAMSVGAAKVHGDTVRAPLNTFKVVAVPAAKPFPAGWGVDNEKGDPATKVVYANEREAHLVADALNYVNR